MKYFFFILSWFVFGWLDKVLKVNHIYMYEDTRARAHTCAVHNARLQGVVCLFLADLGSTQSVQEFSSATRASEIPKRAGLKNVPKNFHWLWLRSRPALETVPACHWRGSSEKCRPQNQKKSPEMETGAFDTQMEHLPRRSRGLSKSSRVLSLISVWFLFASLSLSFQVNKDACSRQIAVWVREIKGKQNGANRVSTGELTGNTHFRVCWCHRMTYYLCLHVFCADGRPVWYFKSLPASEREEITGYRGNNTHY